MPYTKYLTKLNAHTHDILGVGLYSIVVLENSGHALKLTTCLPSIKLATSLLTHKDHFLVNPIEIIGDIGHIKRKRLYAMRLERTHPITTVSVLADSKRFRQLYRTQLLLAGSYKQFGMRNYHTVLENMIKNPYTFEYFEYLIPTLKRLLSFCKQHKCIPDLLNPNNYMESRDGKLILIDPVASSKLLTLDWTSHIWNKEIFLGTHWNNKT